jgi:hypothetical protein
MTYLEFNSKILEFYLNKATSTYCDLSIDRQEMQSIAPSQILDGFSNLKNDWSNLLYSQRNPPRYFGLIAMQCYAASLMEAEGSYSAASYLIRLRELLKLENDNELQQLFRGYDKHHPIQEEIWNNAKQYLEIEHNLKLEIPSKTINAGRFVQYPKSQALLNTEDLKRFTIFFDLEFKIKEVITFHFFKAKLNLWLRTLKLSSRLMALFSDPSKNDQCCRQVFNYYNSWEGELYDRLSDTRSSSVSHKLRSNLLLVFQDKTPQFYEFLNGDAIHIKSENILSLRAHKYFYKGVIFFCELGYYPDEYEESRFLRRGCVYQIIVNKHLGNDIYDFLNRICKDRIELTPTLFLYKISSDTSFSNSPLQDFMASEYPINLRNGLKVNRKSEYLKGFGPQIEANINYSVSVDNVKCDYNPETCIPGLYRIKTDNYPDIKFLILQDVNRSQQILSKSLGWNISSLSIDENYQIEGCYIKDILMNKKIIGRNWIKLNNGLRINNVGENIVLKAIKNSMR